MKISHSELEVCRGNVRQWVAAQLNPGSGGPRPGYAAVTRLAIYKYHATGDADAAREHLERLLGRFKSTSRKLSAEGELNSYVAWAEREGVIVADRKVRLNYDLESGIYLGGEVPRVDVDLVGGGYRAVLLGYDAPAWRSELRTPLLQRAIASHFQRDESEVVVGVQALDGSGLEVVRFTTAEINAAEASAKTLASQIAALLP